MARKQRGTRPDLKSKSVQRWNPSLKISSKNTPKPEIGPRNSPNWSLKAERWRVFKEWQKIVEKTDARGPFKFPAPTNRLTGYSTGRPPGQQSTVSNFSCVFLSRDSPPALFSWNPQFFMSNATGILIFGQKLTYFLRDCYMMRMRWNLCNHNAFPTRIHYTNIRSKRNNP